jgi:purine-binding chemotaxis protein CheW
MRWRTDLIEGMGKRGDDFIIILDVNAVFSSDQTALVAEASADTPEAVNA